MKAIHNEDSPAWVNDMASRAAYLPGLQPQPAVRLVYSREDFSKVPLPERMAGYPELRYMGSKRRLLPWIHGVLRSLPFETAADPFVGSGCVAYLLKAMGKRVVASDFLNFPAVLATATIANSTRRLDGPAVKTLLAPRSKGPNFIEKTFDGIFYTTEDLRFLDRVSGTWGNDRDRNPCRQRNSASMRPRVITRGNPHEGPRYYNFREASMRPRVITRGNGGDRTGSSRAVAASMRPRVITRGNADPDSVMAWSTQLQ